MRKLLRAISVAILFGGAIAAQTASPSSAAKPTDNRPLPDVATLFRDVLRHQKEVDDIRKNYIFKESVREEELDGNSNVKKTTIEEREIFYIGRHRVTRLLSKDGKELSAQEKEKEQKNVDKQVADSKKREAKREEGKQDDDEITVERFLKIAKLSNERREMRNGHEAIVFDFSGDPDVKTHGMAEGAVKKLSGTVWIDEDKRQVMRMEARFDDSFKVGGGLLASLQKGSNFAFEQALVNGEVWLPTYAEAAVGARVLLFKNLHEHQVAQYSDYRKFRTKTSVTLAEPENPKPDK
jgi:hypothetical protein